MTDILTPINNNQLNNDNKTLNPIQRLIKFLFSPAEVLQSIREKHDWRDWVFPLIIMTIFSIAANSLTRDIAIRDSREIFISRLEKNNRLSEEKKQEMIESFDKRSASFNLVANIISTPVVITISFLVIAGMLHFFGNFILGGNGLFSKMFAVSFYTSLVDLVNLIVKVPLVLIKKSIYIYTGLGLFLPHTDTFMFRFLSRFDLFAIWKVILLGLGMAVIYRLNRKTGIITVLILWILYGLLVSFISGIFSFA